MLYFERNSRREGFIWEHDAVTSRRRDSGEFTASLNDTGIHLTDAYEATATGAGHLTIMSRLTNARWLLWCSHAPSSSGLEQTRPQQKGETVESRGTYQPKTVHFHKILVPTR